MIRREEEIFKRCWGAVTKTQGSKKEKEGERLK